ncbi:unnamed protein product [Owenia fusiformis]|uniref:EF-hand domain-containing protein n=1 Tax=Owenia fusiformis TaxID=6347 RepID=A0A8S4PG16_OWEFU|nr:unnamed protein product [Owenia fusiformis]
MMAGLDEQDVYVAQLREVFDSCDKSNTGYIDRKELTELCQKLQLADQTKALLQRLLGSDESGRVSFDEFKEGFVNVLSAAVDDLGSSSEEDTSFVDNQQETPKYVKGNKKYGRRSKPDFKGESTEADLTTDFSDTDFSFQSPRNTPKPAGIQKRKKDRLSAIHSDESLDLDADESSSGDRLDGEKSSNTATGSKKSPPVSRGETFEAEGQMNQSMTQMEYALDPVSEEEHLKQVWRELKVGRDGYLTMPELAKVCSHIGMEETTDEEIQHLFDKLDVDQDGKVSFHEFLHGLFQHGGPTMPSTPVRPLSSTRKPKVSLQMSMNLDERTQTPSILSVGEGAGIFSSLDPELTGYAKPDAIIDLWENLGIPNGAEILQALEFDLTLKVNLQELSYVLEQELLQVDEQNAIYQAAMATYQNELKYLKESVHTLKAEKGKLSRDLTDANNRVGILVKEGDERTANMERAKEKELLSVEQKYQEQIRSLQNEMEDERDIMMSQSAKQRQKLEKDIERLKESEIVLKEKLLYSEKEGERLTKDLKVLSDKMTEYDRVMIRQAKELETAEDLHRRLTDMESSRDIANDEHYRFIQQKSKTLESENKELKDRNDELTLENEAVKQQLSTAKKRGRRRTQEIKRGSGSVLSDYQKPALLKRRGSGLSSSGTSEDDDPTAGLGTPTRTRRKLPKVGVKHGGAGDMASDDEVSVIEKVKSQLETQQKEHDKKVEDLQKMFDSEKRDIEEAFKQEVMELEKSHAEEKMALENTFAAEKEKLSLAHEEQIHREKSAIQDELEQKFALEKVQLTQRIESEESTRQSAEYEERLEKLHNDLEAEFEKERNAIKERYQQEVGELEEKHRMEMKDYDSMFSKGEASLKGQLKEDFYSILEKQKAEWLASEQAALVAKHEEEVARICQEYTAEKLEIEAQYKRFIDDMDQNYVHDQDSYEHEMREKMEDEMFDQMERLKSAFDEERHMLEDKSRMLEEEILELQQQLEGGDGYKQKVEELNRNLANVKDAKRKADDTIEALNSRLKRALEENNTTRENLEEQIEQLQVEKNESIHVVKQEGLQATNKQKTKLDGWEQEKAALEDQLSSAKDNLAKVNASMSMAESQHMREVQCLREETEGRVDMTRYNNLNIALLEEQKKRKEVEEICQVRLAETNKLLSNAHDDHRKAFEDLQQDKAEVSRKLNNTRQLLNEQMERLRKQLQHSAKSDLLVKDLYSENSELMEALYHTEQRQKLAEKQVYELLEQNKAYAKVMNKVGRAAMG